MAATTTNRQRTTVDLNHKSREKRLHQAVAQKEDDTSQYHQLKHDSFIITHYLWFVNTFYGENYLFVSFSKN